MYIISSLTGKIYLDGVEIPLNDSTPQFQQYLSEKDTVGVDFVDATPEEIAEQTQSFQLKELVAVCEYLTDRTLISSVSKEGGEKYLQGQISRYKEKYKVAKQYVSDKTINNQYWYDAIFSEMNTTNDILGYGLTIPDFMGIIVQQFELGEYRSQKFETSIEIFRCKTKDLIVVNESERANACLNLAKNIPTELTIEDLEGFIIQLNSI
jgi:hypothetical protein